MKRILILASFMILLLALIVPAMAANGEYEISQWVVSNGGGESIGGSYSLTGTIGQPDAGSLRGGDYDLGGGFWGGIVEALYDLFLPLIKK
ncbi:MAG: hypothetical protein GTO18_22145 [Anaerolineales bacterium]|nr:hypothetical protein [Anaerolineales bacterium]